MSIQSRLRKVPELASFSPQQQDDLLRSFSPPALARKTFYSAGLRGMMIAFMTGIGAQYLAPNHITIAIIAAVMIIAIPVSYYMIIRQICDEFRLLLLYMLTGKVLPACPRCGYDLTAATHSQCPECGADVKWKPIPAQELPAAADSHETPAIE